jgi:hypothetical protein
MQNMFENLWIGPYQIESEVGTSSVISVTLEGEKLSLLVNGYLLKPDFSEGTPTFVMWCRLGMEFASSIAFIYI